MARLRALQEQYRERPITRAVLLDLIRSRLVLNDLCNQIDPIEASIRRRMRELETEWRQMKKLEARMLAEKERVGTIVERVKDPYAPVDMREMSFHNSPASSK